MRHTPLARRALFVLAATLPAACGGGGGGGGQPGGSVPGDTTAPTVTLAFPPLHALTAEASVNVYGTASDPSGVQYVEVGGSLGVSLDAFATWSASVPLGVGSLLLPVEAEDSLGNFDADAAGPLQVSRFGPVLRNAVGMEWDDSTDRLLATDPGLQALVSIDPASGTATVVSDATKGTGQAFVSPQALAIDSAAGQAYVAEWSPKSIVRVDLASGNRTVVSAVGTGTGTMFQGPGAIALDVAAQVVYVADHGLDAVLAVDLSNGNRTEISGPNVGAGVAFGTPMSVAADPAGQRLLVLDIGLDELLAVDLPTGDRSVVSGAGVGTGPAFGSPFGLRYDAATDASYVVDYGLIALVRVANSTGDRTVVSNAATGAGPVLRSPTSLALELASNRALCFDSITRKVLAVDLSSGDRSVVYFPSVGSGPDLLLPDGGIALDAANGRMWVVPMNASSPWSVDLATGDRTPLGGIGPELRNVQDAAFDATGNRLFLVTNHVLYTRALFEVDATTGARTKVSGDGVGNGPAFVTPYGVATDVSNGRVIVADPGIPAIVAVDLATGDRSILSGNGVGGGDAMATPHGVALHPTTGLLYVLDVTGSPSVLVVDPATGDRTILSDSAHGVGPLLNAARDLVLTPDGSRALIGVVRGMLSVDLATGDRSTVTGPTVGLGSAIGTQTLDVAVDPTGTLAWVADDSTNSLWVVHMATGDRVILSR